MKEQEKEKALKLIKKKSQETELKYGLCARSAMYGLSCYFNFIPEELVNAAYNLSGGVGASSGTCGAFSSGELVIGLKYAPSMAEVGTEEGEIKREIAEQKMIEFRDIFLEEFGTTLCSKIVENIFGKSFDLKDDNQLEEFLNFPGHTQKCASIVGRGAALAAEFILNDE